MWGKPTSISKIINLYLIKYYLQPYNNHKFDFKNQPSIFIGYNYVYKDYKCLTLIRKEVIFIHVFLNEKYFSYDARKDKLAKPISTSYKMVLKILTKETLKP